MNAQLPVDLYENTIGNMEPGSSGYTVPWAMHVDEDGSLWLNGAYTIHKTMGGTVQMLVTRFDQGYEVDISRCKRERWQPGASFVGGNNSVPVVNSKQ